MKPRLNASAQRMVLAAQLRKPVPVVARTPFWDVLECGHNLLSEVENGRRTRPEARVCPTCVEKLNRDAKAPAAPAREEEESDE